MSRLACRAARHDGHPAVAAAGPVVLGSSSWNVSARSSRQTMLKYSAGALSAAWSKSHRAAALAVGVVAARQVDRQQPRHELGRDRVAACRAGARPCPRPTACPVGDAVADPLGAVASVPVAGQVVGIVRTRHRLVGRGDEALVGVQQVGQPVVRHVVAGPVVLTAPARLGLQPVVARLADRHQAGSLVADVTLAVGVHDVLRRYGEGRRGLAEAGPVEPRRGRRSRRPWRWAAAPSKQARWQARRRPGAAARHRSGRRARPRRGRGRGRRRRRGSARVTSRAR